MYLSKKRYYVLYFQGLLIKVLTKMNSFCDKNLILVPKKITKVLYKPNHKLKSKPEP
jgi:hypothetical protein